MSEIVFRDYQVEADDAVEDAWRSGVQRPAVVLPTGTGKSLTMARLVVKAVREWGWRVLLLAHRDELLNQLRDSVHKIDPTILVGKVQAGTREYGPDVVVASVSTLASTVDHRTPLGRRDLILVDEAHHYAATTFRQVIQDFGGFEPDSGAHVAGFTATMFRKDGGLNDIWEKVVFERDIEWAIDNGFLVKPHGRVVIDDGIDLSEVSTTGGDYNQNELEEVMISSVDTTVQAMFDYAKDRSVLLFASGVDHCRKLSDRLNQYGISAAYVTGETPTDERQELYTGFLSGDLQVLVNVEVLTEGTDLPRCDCVIIARPTKSPNLYTQMVGRALRLYPGKDDALVLDLAGSSRELDLMSLTDIVSTARVNDPRPELTEEEIQKKKGTPPKKQRLGVARTEEFDVIHGGGRNPYRWLTTRGGVEFLADGVTVTYLWPDQYTPGMFWVNNVTERGGVANQVIHNAPLPHQDAQKMAEGYAERNANSKENHQRLHRYKSHYTSQPPTDAMVRYSYSLGIPDGENMTKHRLSDEISREIVSRRFEGRL